MIYAFIVAHPVATTVIAVLAVIIVGATSFDSDDWRRL